MVKNPLNSAGDTGSFDPWPGKIPQACAPQLLSPHDATTADGCDQLDLMLRSKKNH